MQEPYYTSSKASRLSVLSSLPVWGLTVAMLVAAIVFVWRYGSNVPSWDDWDMVPTLTGHQSVTLEWLWSQHNEHRVPLPRLHSLLLYRIAGIDLKVGMIVNLLLTAVLVFALIRTAGRLRGHISWTDAFFPLLFFHFGHATNFLWAWQIQFFLSAVISGTALLYIVRTPTRVPVRTSGSAVGVCSLVLILCGANGLALVPPLLAWMAYLLVRHSFSGQLGRYHRAGLFLLIVLTTALAGLYFRGYESLPYESGGNGIRVTLIGGLQLLSSGLGPGLLKIWPAAGLLVLMLVAFSSLFLLRNLHKSREQDRIAGLSAFMGAIILLCLAIGYGRGTFTLDMDDPGSRFSYELRYAVLIVPFWVAVYLIFSIYAPPRFNFPGRAALCLTGMLLLWPHAQLGLKYGRNLEFFLNHLEQDVRAGVPPHQLISRYANYLYSHEVLQDYLPMLREAKVGVFASLADDPPFGRVILPLEPSDLHEAKWRNDTAYVRSYKSYIGFSLPAPRYVSGIYLKFAYADLKQSAPFRHVEWRRSRPEEGAGPKKARWAKGAYSDWADGAYTYFAAGDFANWPVGSYLKIGDAQPSAIVWVNDTVQEIRIHPELNPCAFHLAELHLLVPAGE